MTEEAKQIKVDNGVLKRQVDGLERYALETKADITAIRETKGFLESKVQTLTTENKSLSSALTELSTEADEKIQNLTSANAALNRDLADVRRSLAPLHAELEASKVANVRLKEETDAARKAKTETNAKLEKVNNALMATENALRESQASEKRLADGITEEQARVRQLENQIAAQNEALANKDAELIASNNKLDEALEALKLAQEETVAIQREAETIANELMNIARARTSEKAEYDNRLNEALTDLQRIADEARTREALRAADAARHAEELIAARRESEAALEAAADEAAALQDMISRLRNEAAATARNFDEQRNKYERKLTETAQKAALSAEGSDAEIYDLRNKLAEAMQTIDTLHTEAEQRDAAHVEVLSGMQAALRQLANEFSSIQNDYASLTRAVKNLVTHMDNTMGDKVGQQPLDAWFDEAKKTFVLLVDRVHGERRRADIERDNTRAAELNIEELRSRVLMLEEGLSKAEHEAFTKGALLKEATATLATHQDSATTELRAAASMTAELQAELNRVKEKLDRSNKARLALQEEAAKASSDLADAQAKATARSAALEGTVGSLEASVRVLSNQIDTLQEEKAKQAAALEAQGVALVTTTREKQAVIQEAERAAEVTRQALTQYAAQVTALSDGLRAMEKQAKQTQNLLSLSQEQRYNLEEANAQLRAELDGIYMASLAGAQSMTTGNNSNDYDNNNNNNELQGI